MIKELIQKWDKNKGLLSKDIEDNIEKYTDIEYGELVKRTFDLIVNSGGDTVLNTEEIVEVDHGDYQGTYLYLIPKDIYQPSEYDYLITFVDYGSCSGCDTLLSAQSKSRYEPEEEAIEQFVKDIMTLALHIVQQTKIPFESDWDSEFFM